MRGLYKVVRILSGKVREYRQVIRTLLFGNKITANAGKSNNSFGKISSLFVEKSAYNNACKFFTSSGISRIKFSVNSSSFRLTSSPSDLLGISVIWFLLKFRRVIFLRLKMFVGNLLHN